MAKYQNAKRSNVFRNVTTVSSDLRNYALKLNKSLQRFINVPYVFKNGALGLFERENVTNVCPTLQRFQ